MAAIDELRPVLEDAFDCAQPTDGDARHLIGKALDILNAIPIETAQADQVLADVEAETWQKAMEQVERVRTNLRERINCRLVDTFDVHRKEGLREALTILNKEFPDTKE